MTTGSVFFANSRGVLSPEGDGICYFCGYATDTNLTAKKGVSKTFTDHSACHGGDRVCPGCIASMQSKGLIKYADEDEAIGKIWLASWVVANGNAVAYKPRHMPLLREQCLYPPSAPYLIDVAPGNQKHRLFRCRVGLSNQITTVNLFGKPLIYKSAQLADRLDIVGKIIAIVGKKNTDPGVNALIKVCELFGINTVDEWIAHKGQPLTSLAWTLSDGKDACCERYNI